MFRSWCRSGLKTILAAIIVAAPMIGLDGCILSPASTSPTATSIMGVVTKSPTEFLTFTPTPASSETKAPTSTSTSSRTSEPSIVPTATYTSTAIPTKTFTNQPTATASRTALPSATNTATATTTPKSIDSATVAAQTIIPTFTPSPTRRPTLTPTTSAEISVQDISYGDTVTDKLVVIKNGSGGGTYKLYRFEAEENDRLTITLDLISGNATPLLVLADSKFNILAENDDGDTSIQDYVILEDDVYYITVYFRDNSNGEKPSAEYDLTLENDDIGSSSSPTQTSGNNSNGSNDTLHDGDFLQYGDSGIGTVDDSQPYLNFEFKGEIGDRVQISIEPIDGDLDPLIAVFDGQGKEIQRDSISVEMDVPRSGTYIIVVTRAGVENGDTSGQFELYLEKIGSAEATSEITLSPIKEQTEAALITTASTNTATPTGQPTETQPPLRTPDLTKTYAASTAQSQNQTATAQVVVLRDSSGKVIGEGEVRLFAPTSLEPGEDGQIRVEIKVSRPNANYVAISGVNGLPSPTPDLQVRPTSTQSALLERQFIIVREYMGVDITGIDVGNFILDPIPPSGTHHIIDPDKTEIWKWNIQPDGKNASGSNHLRIEVYLSDSQNNRYEVTNVIEFTIEVTALGATETVAVPFGSEANAAEASGNGVAASSENMQSVATPLPNTPTARLTETMPPASATSTESSTPSATGTIATKEQSSQVTTTAENASPRSPLLPIIVIGLVIVGVIVAAVLLFRRGQQRPSAFISYRRIPSATLATLLAKELERKGINVFVDTRSIDGGGLFPKRLIEAIHDNDVFVCLVGDTTFESDWVREEIKQAHSIGKTMIPVFQESWEQLNPKPAAPMEHIKALLDSDGVHIFDIRNVYMDEAITELAKVIRATARQR